MVLTLQKLINDCWGFYRK